MGRRLAGREGKLGGVAREGRGHRRGVVELWGVVRVGRSQEPPRGPNPKELKSLYLRLKILYHYILIIYNIIYYYV